MILVIMIIVVRHVKTEHYFHGKICKFIGRIKKGTDKHINEIPSSSKLK